MTWKNRLGRFLPKHDPSAIDYSIERLVCEAYQHVPMFYTRLEQVEISPDEIRSTLDLQKIPTSRREDYLAEKNHGFLRHGTVVDRCKKSRTTGTSGSPLFVYMSRYEALCRQYYLFAALRREAEISIPFSVADVGVNAVRGSSSFGQSLLQLGLLRVYRISRLWSIKQQASTLANIAVQVLTGPPSCLELVAEEMLRTGLQMRTPPRLIAPRGEILSSRTRQLLRDAFQCTVADFFSCEEVGNVAWECPHHEGIYHINTDTCLVEILDDQGQRVPDGIEGDVVVTNLFNWTMPFIRYELGDRATLRKTSETICSCGHGGPMMKILAGRADDFIHLPSGRRVSPRTILGLVYKASQRGPDLTSYYLSRFRVEQTALDSIQVLIVPSDHQAHEQVPISAIQQAFRTLDPGLQIRIEIVDSLPSSDAAKFRTIISRVEQPLEHLSG